MPRITTRGSENSHSLCCTGLSSFLSIMNAVYLRVDGRGKNTTRMRTVNYGNSVQVSVMCLLTTTAGCRFCVVIQRCSTLKLLSLPRHFQQQRYVLYVSLWAARSPFSRPLAHGGSSKSTGTWQFPNDINVLCTKNFYLD